MRPARSRRVQAQRKFAQGAYVPPNAAAAAPADNRRDVTQDPTNVTRNNMTAPSLLDVVSLQSASSSPERQGLHNHLTSQPVVLLERWLGRQVVRVSPLSPSTSQKDTSQPRPNENQDARMSRIPVEGPKLRTAKKAKEYKRVHSMALRSKRISKFELKKILGESGETTRKVTFKRKRNSSDEDEPLIYQKNKNKMSSLKKHSLKRNAVRRSSPLVGILKHNAPMMSITGQYVPKLPPGTVKQSVTKKQSAHIMSTPEHNSPEKSPKRKQKRKSSPEKYPKKRQIKKSTPEESSPEKLPINKLAKKCKTNEKKISSKQVNSQTTDSKPAHVVPELVVSVEIKSEDDYTDDSMIDFDASSALNRVAPEEDWVMPDDPLNTDSALTIESTLALGNANGKFTKEGARAIDSMLATEEKLPMDDTTAEEVAVIIDGMLAEDGALAINGKDELAVEKTVVKGGELGITDTDATEGTHTLEGVLATEDEHAIYKTVTKEGARAIDDSIAKKGPLAIDDMLGIEDMELTEGALDGMPNIDGQFARNDTLALDASGATYVPVIPSAQVVQSLQDDDESIDDDLIRLRFDDNSEDEPAQVEKVGDLPKDLGDVSKHLEGSVNPCNPVVVSDMTHEDATTEMKREFSPEPGPSGMQYQFSVYDSDTEEQEDYYSDTKIYLGKNIPERYLHEVFHNTAVNLEQERNRTLQKKTCVGASLCSDRDVINTPKEILESRCKVCKACIRIEKLMKISALLTSKIELRRNTNGQNNNAETPESDLVEEQDDHEVPSDSTDEDQNQDLYLDLLPKNSGIMLKIGTNVQHGRELLAVCLIPKCKSRKSVFLLEEKEHVLDGLIETLTLNQNDTTESAEGRIDNADAHVDNAEGRSGNKVNVSSNSRLINLSSDSELSDGGITPEQERTNRVQRHKIIAAKKRLAKAKLMQDRIMAEKEKQIAELEKQKKAEIARIMAKKNMCEVEISRYQQKFNDLQEEKEKEFAKLKGEIRAKLQVDIEPASSVFAEVDGMAKVLDKEKDAKNMNKEKLAGVDLDQPSTSGQESSESGVLVDAPVYYPSEEEFADPLIFYEKIWPEAVRFGICKIVPPPGWQPPPHKEDDEMRFDVTNQYISRLFSRWGPAARELCAIKLCLKQQKISSNRLPTVDGVEINLPKLYHTVQRHGGLETVINKKKWGRVVEDMKFSRGAPTERRLDQIYVKLLLPYDTLSHKERHEIMAKVELAWQRKYQKLFDRAINPLYRQKRMLSGLQEDSEDEDDGEDPDTVEALSESEDCIIKGGTTTLAKFKKAASFAYESTFGQGSEGGPPPKVKDVEEEYWRIVTYGAEHLCVNSAAIDTGAEGYGFTKNKNDSYSTHPWNPKMVSQNRRNVLSYLDAIIGLTVPTLLLGMLYSTSCWHKDPHQIAWIEYQHVGLPRVWHAIAEFQTKNFRKAVEILCPISVQNKSLWLPTDISMIPPDMLRKHNVTLSRVEQGPGEFIMVFPNTYTSCISTGYTVAESVYFAPPSWLKRLWTVFKETRESCEPTMFAMEHLLYNIARDAAADKEIMQTAQPLFERMLHEEVTNRQMLQERGITFVHDLYSSDATPSTSSGKKKAKQQYIPRDQEECEYCRATLYLSKVKGLTKRNTLLCLEHALMMLDTEKYKDADISHVQVLVHVSVKELNTANDDMKRRLRIP